MSNMNKDVLIGELKEAIAQDVKRIEEQKKVLKALRLKLSGYERALKAATEDDENDE